MEAAPRTPDEVRFGAQSIAWAAARDAAHQVPAWPPSGLPPRLVAACGVRVSRLGLWKLLGPPLAELQLPVRLSRAASRLRWGPAPRSGVRPAWLFPLPAEHAAAVRQRALLRAVSEE